MSVDPSKPSAAGSLVARIARGPILRQPLLITSTDPEHAYAAVKELASVWLCSASKQPCGACPGCRDVERGMGERFFHLDSRQDGSIAAVGEFRHRAALRFSERQILVLSSIDQATPAAHQSLLKVLEEVPEGSAIILTASRAMLIPETLRSRCLTIVLPPLRPRTRVPSEAVTQAAALLTATLPTGLSSTADVPEAPDLAKAISDLLRAPYQLPPRYGAATPNAPIHSLADAATEWVRDQAAGRFSDRASIERLQLSLT